MGFRCPICKQDFGMDKAAFEKHLRDEDAIVDMSGLAATNLSGIVKVICNGIQKCYNRKE